MKSFATSPYIAHKSIHTTLMTFVSLLSISLGLGMTMEGAHAQCVTNENVATCTGDLSAGVTEDIDFDFPPVQTVTVDSTTTISPVAGNSGVDFSGEDTELVDLTVRAPLGINVTGPTASGINVGIASATSPLTDLFDGDILIDSVANISAIGDSVQAISAFVSGSGNITITSVGDLTANVSNGVGQAINASVGQTGNVVVTSTGNIVTTNVEGINARTGTGNVTITNEGNINVSGDGSEGIIAATENGVINLQSVGNVTTAGTAGNGLLTIFNGNVFVSSQGDLTLTGDNSSGIAVIQGAEAPTGNFAIINSTGDISATGANSFGIFASLDQNMAGFITSSGNISATNTGIRAEVGAGGAFIQLDSGTVAGGTGAGIDIPNVIGVENASVSIDIGSATTVTATSGNAIVSNAASTTIDNAGLIDGSVLLRTDGGNRINNLAGATFAPQGSALVGTGNFIVNEGTFSPFGLGTLGVTQVTGNLFSQDTAVYQVDISDTGSDATSVDGQFTLNGTLDINATTPQSTFAVNDIFSIADATGGIFGAFSGVTDNLAGFELVPLVSRDRSQLAAVVTTDGIFTTGDCSSASGVVTCSGNQADGITNLGLMPDFASVTSNQLVVDNLTEWVGAPTDLPAVDILVNSPTGYFADIDLGNEIISTSDRLQTGISVVNTGGDVTIQSAGEIITQGSNARGIIGYSTNEGDVSISSSSRIITSGFLGQAIFARIDDDGSISVDNSGNLLSAGNSANGIRALVRGRGVIDINNLGNIRAEGSSDTDAIFADLRGGGDIIINNTGNLSSAGGRDLRSSGNITALVGDEDDDNGLENGNITIVSDGDLLDIGGEGPGGIFARIDGEGDIDIDASGSISAGASTFRSSGIFADIQGAAGNVDIFSRTTINASGTGIVALVDGFVPGAGTRNHSIDIDHQGDIIANSGGISARTQGRSGITINSQGNFDAGSTAIGVFGDKDVEMSITHAGNLHSNNRGDANAFLSSPITATVGNFFGTETRDMAVDFTGSITFDPGRGDDRSDTIPEASTAGIDLVSINPRNMIINLTGNITTDNPNVHGISAVFRDADPDLTGSINITSNGDIAVTGENADGIRIATQRNNTSVVNIEGGSVTGGVGAFGSGVDFLSVAGSTNTLNVNTGTVSALSKSAVRGLDGDETVNNSGTITGSVMLGGGMNSFNNLMGGRFNSGLTVDLAGGVLHNSGILAPGNSIGTTNLNGDLVLDAAGTLAIEIEAPDQSDRVDVSGTTTLGGTLNVTALGLLSTYQAGNQFTIIDSAGDVSGMFATTTDNLPDLDVEAETVDGGDGGEEVQLILVAMDDPSPNPSPGADNTTDKSIHPNALQAGAASASMYTEIVQTRARKLVTGGQIAPTPDSLALGMFDNSSTVDGEPFETAQKAGSDINGQEGTFAWLSGYGAARGVDDTTIITGYDSTMGGIAFGLDSVFTHDDALFTLGISGGYSSANIDSGPSSASVQTWHVGAYGSLEKNNWLLSGVLAYGFQDYDFTRSIGIGSVVASGQADGNVFSASFAASHNIAPLLGVNDGKTRISPLLRFDHVSAHRNGFTETGAGVLNLTVDDDDFTYNGIGIGVEASTEIELPNGMIARPNAEVRWEHSFGDNNAMSSSSIASVAAANFTTPGAIEDKDRAVVGAGIEIDVSDKITANFNYDGTFSSGFSSHSGSAGLKIKF